MLITVMSVAPLLDGEEICYKIEVKDGRVVRRVSGEIILDMAVCMGLPLETDEPFEIDEDALLDIMFLMKKTGAVKKGISLIAFSQNTKKSIREKLMMRGYEREVASEAALYLEALGYINEFEQATLLASDLAEKSMYGRVRIRNALLNKGFDTETVKKVLENCDADFGYLCAMRIKSLGGRELFSERTSRSKMITALMRYGFTFEDIKNALRYEED